MLHVESFGTSNGHPCNIYPWGHWSLRLAGDRYQWRTAAVSSSSHCPSPSPAAGEKKPNKQERLKTILSYYYTLQFNESLLRLHTDLPEPDDLFTAASIVSVDGVSLPVYQVNLLHTTQHDLGRNTFSLRQKVYRPLHSWVFVFKHTSNSFASKYCRYCWGRTSLKPSKKACVCSSTPLDRRHSATSLHRQTQAQP